MGWRIDVEADNVAQLAGEQGIVGSDVARLKSNNHHSEAKPRVSSPSGRFSDSQDCPSVAHSLTSDSH